LSIAEELRKRNPDSAECARGLSVSYNNLGDIYTALGDTKSALKSYESSLCMVEELRKRNPDSVEYTRDLVISYFKLNLIDDLIWALKYMKRKNMFMDPPLVDLCDQYGIE
jgi:tetratricopeptide (TPR) repeat protein